MIVLTNFNVGVLSDKTLISDPCLRERYRNVRQRYGLLAVRLRIPMMWMVRSDDVDKVGAKRRWQFA